MPAIRPLFTSSESFATDPIRAAAASPALRGFHMLAAITQDTINFQLKKLWKDRVIRRRLEIQAGALRLDAELGPPRVFLGDAERPGTVVFVLSLPQGSLTYWDLSGKSPTSHELGFRDWSYGFRVNLDFAQIARDAALDHRGIPNAVKDKLTAFTSDDFTIRQLFMNFQDADLASYDPAYTVLGLPDGGRAPVGVIDQFRQTLTTYFKSLSGTDNPYILGYSVERRPTTRPPALFEPTAATFATTRHPTQAGLSTLDFMLMTEHAALPMNPEARRGQRAWIDSNDHDGRMVIDGHQFRTKYVDGVLLPAVLTALDVPGPWRSIAVAADGKTLFGVDDGRAAVMFPEVPAHSRAVYRHSDNLDADPDPANKGCGRLLLFDGVLGHYQEERDDISCTMWPEPGSDIAIRGRVVIERSQMYCTYPLGIRTFNFGAITRIEQPFRIGLVAGRFGGLDVDLTFGEPVVHRWSDIGIHLKPGDLLLKLLEALGLGVVSLETLASRLEQGVRASLDQWTAGVKRSLGGLLDQVQTRVILPAGEVFFYKGITYLGGEDVVALDISYKTERAPSAVASAAATATLETRHALMKHHLAAAPIAGEHRLAVAQDADGEPLLFSVGSDGRFCVLHRTVGATGWTLVDLTPPAVAGHHTGAFELSQGQDGNLFLAVALHPPRRPDAARLFVSPPIAANLAVTDWSRQATRWVERAYGAGPGKITRLLFGTNDDGDGAPLALAVIAGAKEATHVRFNADASDARWAWAPWPLPEHARDILGLAVGVVDGDRGVYTLYRVGKVPALVFTSLPDPELGGKVARYDFTLPGEVAAMAVVAGTGSSSDVYVAGDGVHLFRGSAPTSTPIVSASASRGARELIACSDGARVSLWIRGADHRLDHVEGGADGWSSPVCLGRDVAQVAPIRNRVRRTDALFTVGRAGGLRHRWFDRAQHAWRTSDVPLPSTGVTTEIDCYCTQLTLADGGRPRAGRTLHLTASAWTYAIINGRAAILDGETPVEVETDVAGEITILQPVDGLAAARITIAGEELGAPITVDPIDAVRDRLRSFATGAELAAARTGSGKPLFATPPPARQLDAAARSLQAMIAMEGRLDGGGLATASAADVGFAIGPAGDVWTDLGRTLAEVFGPISDAIVVAAGDALESMRQAFEPIGRIATELVAEGLKVVAELGERLVTFVIETAPQVYQMVQWVLKQTLGIDLDVVVDLLGYVFPWDDILATQRVIAHVTRCAFDEVKGKIVSVEPAIDGFFDLVAGGVDRLATLGAEVLGTKLGPSLLAQPGARPEHQAALLGPAGSWLKYQLGHGGAGAPGGAGFAIASPLVEVIRRFMTEIALPLAESLIATGTTVFDELRASFEAGTLTVQEVVLRLGRGVVLGAIDAMRTAIKGAVRFAGELILMLRDLIDVELAIPVLGPLYRRLTKGGRMSPLEVLSLGLAVPATAMVKLATGAAPFTEAEVAHFVGLDHRGVFAMLSTSAPAPMAASASMAMTAGDKPMTFGRVYSYVGGFTSTVAGFISGMADVFTALAGEADPPAVEEVAGSPLKKFFVRKEVLQVALSAINVGMSFPVGDDSPSLITTRVLWGASIPMLIKDVVLLFAPEKFTGQRVVGGIEIGWAGIQALTYVVLAVVDLADTDNPEYNWPISVWQLGDNLVGAAASVATAATRFNPEPQTKVILGGVAGALVALSSVSLGLRTFTTVLAENVHYNY